MAAIPKMAPRVAPRTVSIRALLFTGAAAGAAAAEDVAGVVDAVEAESDVGSAVEINASGHIQELERNFSLLSLVGMALNVGSVWPAAAGSILIAIANGGVRP